MLKEAVRHTGCFPDIYLKDRKTLVFTLRTARKDASHCILHCFARTEPKAERIVDMKVLHRDGLFDYHIAEICFSKVARYQKYYFAIENKEKCYYSANGFTDSKPQDGYFEFLYADSTNILKIPKWCQGQIYYQIFPERFCNGDRENDPPGCESWGTPPTRINYMGGDIKGITGKLSYLNDLGVDCIYINPIFKADFNHKYATTDYFEIDPGFGTNDDFRAMIQMAHTRGIKVILDGVFNHSGIRFKPFVDVIKNRENSEYRDWFYITEFPVEITHRNYECVGAYKYMPKLNSGNLSVRQFIIKVMDYWIKEYGIDGWRLDVADEVDESVWTEARVELKASYPDVLLLGETWGSGLRLMNGSQMDAIMNYVFMNAVRDFIAYETIDAMAFDDRLQRMLSEYPMEMNLAMYNLLDSHDTDRFVTACGHRIEKLLLAAAFQMCFVGSPAIYYGDEIGMEGDNDPDCRKCMEWDENRQNKYVRSEYKRLAEIRHRYKSIRYGDYYVNFCGGRQYGFIRAYEGENTYIIMNASDNNVTVRYPVKDKVLVDINTGIRMDARQITGECFFNNDIVNYSGIVDIGLKPYEVQIFKGGNEDYEE